MANEKHLLVRIGDRISDTVSRLFAHPSAQIGVILFCCTWFIVGSPTDLLTAALSILAITLTQMVLNGQYEREAEAHRRDVAMPAKLDELIRASRRARDEMAGIEEDLNEDEIRELREDAKELIEEAAKRSGELADGEAAKQAIERVGDGRIG